MKDLRLKDHTYSLAFGTRFLNREVSGPARYHADDSLPQCSWMCKVPET